MIVMKGGEIERNDGLTAIEGTGRASVLSMGAERERRRTDGSTTEVLAMPPGGGGAVRYGLRQKSKVCSAVEVQSQKSWNSTCIIAKKGTRKGQWLWLGIDHHAVVLQAANDAWRATQINAPPNHPPLVRTRPRCP